MRNRSKTVNALEPSSLTDTTEISAAVLVHGAEEAGPKGPTEEIIAAVVEMKPRNPM
jgi:hypothetical protein